MWRVDKSHPNPRGGKAGPSQPEEDKAGPSQSEEDMKTRRGAYNVAATQEVHLSAAHNLRAIQKPLERLFKDGSTIVPSGSIVLCTSSAYSLTPCIPDTFFRLESTFQTRHRNRLSAKNLHYLPIPGERFRLVRGSPCYGANCTFWCMHRQTDRLC